jgi:hypothetical protein
VIFAFDHEHELGEVCSHATCEAARRAPVLVGSEVIEDVPMKIVRVATEEEYLGQPIPEGWVTPPLVYGCGFIYEVQCD